MNRYSLVCYYCNFSWEVNYVPQDTLYCQQCKDSNIKIVDKSVDRIDYYVGAKPFPEKPKKWSDRWDV